jgi:predicted small metal-binding protein
MTDPSQDLTIRLTLPVMVSPPLSTLMISPQASFKVRPRAFRAGMKFDFSESNNSENSGLERMRRASMKTMTCRNLGGACDQKLSAESWNEMVGLMVKHVTDNHPDVAKQMEQMHNADSQKWGRETKPKWEATPEE